MGFFASEGDGRRRIQWAKGRCLGQSRQNLHSLEVDKILLSTNYSHLIIPVRRNEVSAYLKDHQYAFFAERFTKYIVHPLCIKLPSSDRLMLENARNEHYIPDV